MISIKTKLSVQRPIEDDFEDEKYSTTTSAPTTTTAAPTHDYEVGDYEYPADEPSSEPKREDDEVHPQKGLCDIAGSSDKYAFTHLRGELFLFHGKVKR